MLVELAYFAAGCVAGGYFVFRGMRAAMRKELACIMQRRLADVAQAADLA